MKTTLALMIALGLVAWGSTGSAEPPEAKTGTMCKVRARAALVCNQETDSLATNPMCVQIKAVVDSFRTVEERLQIEFYTAADDSGALLVMAELADLDLALKRRIMEIQITHARLEGRTRLARRIDTSLMALADPPGGPQNPAQ